MGNGNKVAAPPELSVEALLREAIPQKTEKPVLYSLEDEFTKTKEKKDILLYAGFFFFLVALVVVVFLIVDSYQKRSAEIKIDVSDFRDLNLADVLQNTKKDEARLNRLKREIADLRITWQSEKKKTSARFTTERDILALKPLEEEEREEAVASLAREERAALLAVDARFTGEIKKREQEIEDIQKRLESQDQELAGGAGGADLALETELKVRELESKRIDESWERRLGDEQDRYGKAQDENRALMQRMTDSLILRYNPLFREQNLLALLPAGGGGTLPALSGFSAFAPLLASEEVFAQASFDDIRRNAREGRLLLERIHEVRYTNSIAPALAALAQRNNALIDGYESLWQRLVQRAERKNTQLQAFTQALNLVLQQSKDHGCVVDASNPERLQVVLNSKINFPEGAAANVLDARGKRIGSVRFEKTFDGVFAVPIDAFTQAAEPMNKLKLQ